MKDFCTKRKCNNKICERLQESCYSIGSYKIYNDDLIIPNIVEQAIANLLPAQKVQEFLRLLNNTQFYVSERYIRAK